MPRLEPSRSRAGSYILIAVIVAALAALFAYTAGRFSPHRLTPEKILAALAPPTGPALGHRRNHAKGICFTGTFDANGAGTTLSRARVFVRGQYPALGRFNFSGPDPNAPDATSRVRGMGLSITTPDRWVWRTAMITPPFFPVSTPRAFYELALASQSKDPEAMKRVVARYPEIAAFGAWAKSAPWTGSYAEERYNSLDSYVFTNAAGERRSVRWSLLPAAAVVPVSPEDLAKRGPDFLEQEITERVRSKPPRWALIVTVADPGDPTADPSKAWPESRRTVEVGTLTVAHIQAESDGPCRDINFDPTILPPGMRTSDDPFPAARSSAYARSYDLRTAESAYYSRTSAVAPP